MLGFSYVAPVVAALRQPTFPAPAKPLPQLSLPAIGMPLLRTPKLYRPAPLPALPAQQLTSHHPPLSRLAQKAFTSRVPVVSDSHAQAPRASRTKTTTPKDPLANAAVVEDNIGIRVAVGTEVRFDNDTAQNQWAPGNEAVNIASDPDPIHIPSKIIPPFSNRPDGLF